MNLIGNAHCRWFTGTITALIVAAPTAVYTGLLTQTQKWGTNFILDKGAEAVTCVTQKDNASNKLFKELELKTSVVWSNMNYDVRTHMLTRVPALNISTKEPGKNLEIINEWIKEAAACNLMKFECNKERVQCNEKLPSYLEESLASQKLVTAEKAYAAQKIEEKQKQIDPLLVRQGKCEELESIKAENVVLSGIKEKYIAQTKDLERLTEKLIEAEKIKEKYEELTGIKENYISKSKDYEAVAEKLKDMTEKMNKYKKLYEDAVWFPVRSEL